MNAGIYHTVMHTNARTGPNGCAPLGGYARVTRKTSQTTCTVCTRYAALPCAASSVALRRRMTSMPLTIPAVWTLVSWRQQLDELDEVGTFLLSGFAVTGIVLALLLRRWSLRLYRRVGGCGGACAGGRGKGKRWQGLAVEEDLECPEKDEYGEAVNGVMQVQVRLHGAEADLVEEGPEELELELTGLRNIADIKASVASMYAPPWRALYFARHAPHMRCTRAARAVAHSQAHACICMVTHSPCTCRYAQPERELDLARQLVVQCLDRGGAGLVVSLPNRTPIDRLIGVEQLLITWRGLRSGSGGGGGGGGGGVGCGADGTSLVGASVATRKAALWAAAEGSPGPQLWRRHLPRRCLQRRRHLLGHCRRRCLLRRLRRHLPRRRRFPRRHAQPTR